MQLNESEINALTPTQVRGVADLLELVFQDSDTTIELDEAQTTLTATLFQAIQDKSFKQLFFNRLDPDTQFELLEVLPESELSYLLPFDDEDQIQDITEPLPSTPGKQSNDSLKQIFLDLVAIVQDTSLSPAKAALKAEEKIKDLTDAQHIPLAKALISQLISLNIPINTPQNFGSYVRFYVVLNFLSPRNPAIAKAMIPIIEKTILALHALPNGQWIVKVLDQLPVGIIEFIIRRLSAYERVTHFEKRMMYCKLLLDIRDQSKNIPTKALHLVLKQHPIS